MAFNVEPKGTQYKGIQALLLNRDIMKRLKKKMFFKHNKKSTNMVRITDILRSLNKILAVIVVYWILKKR